MLNKWFKVIGNSSPMMEPITCQSVSDSHALDSTEQSSIARLIDSSPASTPFRKKAITSIERTRKLSILLKHQQYLVSYCYRLRVPFIIRFAWGSLPIERVLICVCVCVWLLRALNKFINWNINVVAVNIRIVDKFSCIHFLTFSTRFYAYGNFQLQHTHWIKSAWRVVCLGKFGVLNWTEYQFSRNTIWCSSDWTGFKTVPSFHFIYCLFE